MVCGPPLVLFPTAANIRHSYFSRLLGPLLYRAVSSSPHHLDLRSCSPKLSHLSPFPRPRTFPQAPPLVDHSTLRNKLGTFATHHIR